MIEHNVWRILFGAAFTGLTSVSLGLMVVQALQLPVTRREARLFGFLLGSAALSTAVFSLAVMWMVHPAWFAAVGAAAIGGSVWKRAWTYGIRSAGAGLPRVWRWLFTAGLVVFGLYTFAHALAPEVSPDGSAYHLGTVVRWFRDGGMAWYTTNMYSNMPMGVETLFLYAFTFGRHSAAALVHWQFLLVLPLLLLECGRRFGEPRAGAAGGLLVFFSPLFGIDGASAYVDVATAAVVFGGVYLLLLFEKQPERGLAIATGALAGFAYACKLTAFPSVILAVLFAGWCVWGRRVSLRVAVLAPIAAGLVMAPWLVRNALMFGNPFSPFLNAWFPNPYIRISFEEAYRANLRDYYGAITSPWQIPLEVTMWGQKLNGLLGPVFLLAPLALLALRWPLGRRVVLAALVFLAPYPSNIGARFLLTAAPLVAFALGMVLTQWRGIAVLVILFHAWTSLPGTVKLYAAEHAWTMRGFHWNEAIRKPKREEYLAARVPGYRISRMIEEQVPPHGKVLTWAGPAEAYTTRDILVVYQAGLNNMLGELLIAGVSGDYQPTRLWEFRFPKRETRRVRIVQTRTTEQEWAIAELKVLTNGGELHSDQFWRLRARPNEWDVQYLFDKCPITRWKTWEKSRPGMFVELDFGRAMRIDGVRAFVPPSQPDTSARVEVEAAEAGWETVAAAPVVTEQPMLENGRRMAIEDLKRFGITHLAIQDSDEFISRELYLNRPAWGITLLGQVDGIKLYRLD